MRIARPVLIAIAVIVAGSPVLHAAPPSQARTRVENAIAFLAATGDADALDAAARLRNMLDDGKIVVGEIGDAENAASPAWTANGIISLNPDLIGRPRPYIDVDWSPTAANRDDWVSAFTLSQALVLELSNLPIGKTREEKVEGWRESLSGATLWLRLWEARLQEIPDPVRTELAYRLSSASTEVRDSVGAALQDLGGDFSDLQWRNPDGGIFRSKDDALQYLADFEARMAAFQADAPAPPQSRQD